MPTLITPTPGEEHVLLQQGGDTIVYTHHGMPWHEHNTHNTHDLTSVLAPREEHVFLQHDDETDVDTMLRVEAMGEQELFAKRRALCELRDRLNMEAAQLLVGMAEGRAGGG